MNNDFRQFFKGKRITLMGLGLLGRGVGDAAFLAKCGARVLVTDKKSATDLASSIKKLKKYPNMRFALGGHKTKDFQNADMVIKAAGVPLDSLFIKEARKNKALVYMSTALFVKLLPPDVTVVGVTGTRGKTTTTILIYEILTAAKKRVHLGGNVRGVSTLALLPKVKSGDFVVLELDSWQLQGFRDLKISPQIAVFTTLFSDHMNYYGTMEKYFHDKTAIFAYQKKEDVCIAGEQVFPLVRKNAVRAARLPKEWKLALPGTHNRMNAACALAATDALGVPRTIAKKAIENFRGVPGRLEFVSETRGVKIYNDTTATTPDATVAALRALGSKKKNIILIAGGADKGLDMSALAQEISRCCKAVVFLAGSGTEKLTYNLKPITYNLTKTRTLKIALDHAVRSARIGDTILFSPAFASFDMFKNEYDRGERFNRLVRRLKISNI